MVWPTSAVLTPAVLVTMMALQVDLVLCEMYGTGITEFEKDMLGRTALILQNEGWIPSTFGKSTS